MPPRSVPRGASTRTGDPAATILQLLESGRKLDRVLRPFVDLEFGPDLGLDLDLGLDPDVPKLPRASPPSLGWWPLFGTSGYGYQISAGRWISGREDQRALVAVCVPPDALLWVPDSVCQMSKATELAKPSQISAVLV